MADSVNWVLYEEGFDPQQLHYKETIFTIGNGYLSTRGAFEEGYPDDRCATFVHGVFDDVPIVFTELANAPDWLPMTIYLDGERFGLDSGTICRYERRLDLRTGLLKREVEWVSPSGRAATLIFERFVSLADPHVMLIRCQVTPEFQGRVEFRATLNGNMDNEGVAHWNWACQGQQGETVYLQNRTRATKIDLVTAMRLIGVAGAFLDTQFYDVKNSPTLSLGLQALPGETLIVDKYAAIATSRDADNPLELALDHLGGVMDWSTALEVNTQSWAKEWECSDVVIDGDDEAQIATRFSLFQLLIAAPRDDDRVNIGAKTLSGFGYRGHSFWDTEIFMLPFFTYTAPHIARNLLNYRYQRLSAAREKARRNGFEGAQFPWESAATGEEVTPTWVPHWADRTQLVRIWTGDIEIHISADIAYAAYQYWRVTGDDQWLIDKGAELILDTAKFWAARAEWNAESDSYEYTDVIGPDEYHEHVDNNYATNRLAQWNLQMAFQVLDWLETHTAQKKAELVERLALTDECLAHWRVVIEKMYLPIQASGLIEQFQGYFERKEVDLVSMEPRSISVQSLLGIQSTNMTQVLKQPDVLLLLYLLREHYSDEILNTNYDYYTPRTDLTFGSSLGPSIQAIMACEVGDIEDAYRRYILAARADLRDARGNVDDGIHAASAGGTWQAIVFGFAGLRLTAQGWTINPHLPAHWKHLKFKFFFRGEPQVVEITNPEYKP